MHGTDAVSCADIWFPTESNFKPYVDEEVKRQHFSGTELLKKGITVTASSPNHSQSKQENATSLRTGNLHCSQTEKVTINEKSRREDQLPLKNFSYAMEGPLATGYPKSTHQQNETCAVFKGNSCTDDIEEEERKQVLNRPTSTLLTPTNLSLGKISEKKSKSKQENVTSPRTGNVHCSQTEKVTSNEKSRREDQLPLENFTDGPLATGYPKSTHQQNETKTKSTKVKIGYTKRDGLASPNGESCKCISVLDGRSNCNR
ncbi:hypothetical protein pdam_00020558, partial [Pocillopora damicornis]